MQLFTKKKLPLIIDGGALSTEPWLGKVSAGSMIDSGMTSAKAIAGASSRLEEFFVQCNPLATTRCIDGRNDPLLDEHNLGAQVPGGAPGAALAYRLGVDTDDIVRGSFLDDAKSMIDQYVRLGFAPGGHRDEKSHDDVVGCGAIDGMQMILGAMTDPQLVETLERLVAFLLGTDFDRDTFLRILGAAVMVNSRADAYFRGRDEIITMLEAKYPGSVAVLKGNHQECLVIVNLVPNTTFVSNRFAAEFGVQAFGYDLWYSREIARKLLPRPEQAADRQRFVTARIMYTVATLMALTDGSQHLIIRQATETTSHKTSANTLQNR